MSTQISNTRSVINSIASSDLPAKILRLMARAVASSLRTTESEFRSSTAIRSEGSEEAMILAESGGWVRPFVEAGPVMASPLERLEGKGVEQSFIQRLLAALESGGATVSVDAPPKYPSFTPRF